MSWLIACSLLVPFQLLPVAPQDAPSAPAAVRLLDVTGDGLLDQLTLGDDGSLAIAVNTGSKSFLAIQQQLPTVRVSDVLVSDLDEDGLLDLYLVSPGANVALLGDGAGYFTTADDALGLADAGNGLSAERLDIDADGLSDVLLHNDGSDVLFWARAPGRYVRSSDTPARGTGSATGTHAGADRGAGTGAGTGTETGSGASGVPGTASTPIGPTLPGMLAPGHHDELDTDHFGGDLGRLLPPDWRDMPLDEMGTIGAGPTAHQAFQTIPFNTWVAVELAAFVDDNAGEVGPPDIPDGSLTGGDVSTFTGTVTHAGYLSARKGTFGASHTSSGYLSAIGGGFANTASGIYSAVGGGRYNVASGASSTVAGGGTDPNGGNTASGSFATVGGGRSNHASGSYTTIAGGDINTVSGTASTIGGGRLNKSTGAYESTVSGGFANVASAKYATIGGGARNIASGVSSTVGGGGTGYYAGNTASGIGATVAGGGGYFGGNTASGNYSSVGGGDSNIASSTSATVAGGSGNTATAYNTTVGGGYVNVAGASAATVAGGHGNTASGVSSTIPGGLYNLAEGAYSFAAGRKATANEAGAFVWGDSYDAVKESVAPDTFNVFAAGGAHFFTNDAQTTGVELAAGGGSWVDKSDRAVKEHFEDVDVAEVLARVTALPVTTWNYKTQDDGIRHMGPTSQDFRAAFGLGSTDKGIATVDRGGVTLAAIQGLVQRLAEVEAAKDAEVAALRAELQALRARLDEQASR